MSHDEPPHPADRPEQYGEANEPTRKSGNSKARKPRPDNRVPPSALDAEEATLGACILSPIALDDVLPLLAVSDFYKPSHQYVWDTLRSMRLRYMPIDVITVAEQLKESGLLEAVGGLEALQGLVGATPMISNAAYYAERIIAAAQSRAFIYFATEVADYGYNGDAAKSAEDVVTESKSKLDEIATMGRQIVRFIAGTDFMANGPEPYDWIVPFILERDDRMLLTGGEGSGKSMLLLQWAVMTAAGVHWWIPEARVRPRSVLFIDGEVGAKRTRRRIQVFKTLADKVCPGWEENLHVYSRPEDIDISTRAGATWLASLVDSVRPDVVFLGPIYRFTTDEARPGDMGGANAAKRSAFAFDKIRERFQCAFVGETHAPKGDAIGKRDLRPFGSAVWLRWPEFGYGLAKQNLADAGNSVDNRDWVPWRGDRDPREWPACLVETHEPNRWRMEAVFDDPPSYNHTLLRGDYA